jgi:hypothetical protein
LVIHSCDDGNLIQEDISFESVTTTQSCTNGIIYKLKDQEALLPDIPATTFTNETATTTLEISTTNRSIPLL